MINITKDLFIEVMKDALQGNRENLEMRLRIIIKKLKKDSPDLASELSDVLLRNNNPFNAIRGIMGSRPPTPVDADSRQKLLVEVFPVQLTVEPLWPEYISISLNRFAIEWEKREQLLRNNLLPSRSLLMDGPPGVGKTLAAKWLAEKMGLPLLTLDLASVMSSFLGKTGNNIRAVLDYAHSFPCVLLLDEFDSIAKKRDDASDVGELKRLVTVLLQAIDEWPNTSILVAATNHGELLDPAVWRRFDRVINFDYPSQELIQEFLFRYEIPIGIASNLSKKLIGKSFAVIERALNQAKRNSVIENVPVNKAIIEELYEGITISEFIKLLHNDGMSQRQISSELSVSRPFVRKIINEEVDDE